MAPTQVCGTYVNTQTTYRAGCKVELRLDGTETQVRRPQAHRVGRPAFVSGRRKQNTHKTTAAATSMAARC